MKSREGKGDYAGKWFTNVNAYKIETVGDAPAPVAATVSANSASVPSDEDDLPF